MPSASLSPPFLSLSLRHSYPSPFELSKLQFSGRRKVTFFAATSDRRLEASWIPSDANDSYGGWSIVEPELEKKKVLPKFLILGIGTSMAILLAAIARYSFPGKGFRYRLTVPLQSLFMPSHSKGNSIEAAVSDASETKAEDKSAMDNLASSAVDEDHLLASGEKRMHVIIPVAADATQEEALSVLKKLKIIENDVESNELCTRREYARWLVKANLLLERKSKQQIAPSMLIAGSTVTAFDDISVTDPDFWFIQSLAETGIVPSKLSASSLNFLDVVGSECQGRVNFFPESFINRLDLVNWKAQFEYSVVPEIEDEMLMKKVGFMDIMEVGPNASRVLFTDLLAGDNSIVARVFGNSRRLQPRKPVTKAQAAVALTTGRMADAIHGELSRLEAENASKQVEMEEIRSELLLRGEIQRFWEEKINEKKTQCLEVERDYLAAMHDLEKEKMVRDECHVHFLKEKAVLDCQQQLLLSLKGEVDEMRERLTTERTSFVAEQRSVEELLVDLHATQEAIVGTKSILEAEIEAVRILRSWVEDEAARTQSRAKVLEAAGRRWKWVDS